MSVDLGLVYMPRSSDLSFVTCCLWLFCFNITSVSFLLQPGRRHITVFEERFSPGIPCSSKSYRLTFSFFTFFSPPVKKTKDILVLSVSWSLLKSWFGVRGCWPCLAEPWVARLMPPHESRAMQISHFVSRDSWARRGVPEGFGADLSFVSREWYIGKRLKIYLF